MELKSGLAIREDKVLRDEMLIIQEFFISQSKPLIFNPHDKANVVLEGESTFEQVCITLQENGMQRVKQMTEHEFYSTLQYFQKKYEKTI